MRKELWYNLEFFFFVWWIILLSATVERLNYILLLWIVLLPVFFRGVPGFNIKTFSEIAHLKKATISAIFVTGSSISRRSFATHPRRNSRRSWYSVVYISAANMAKKHKQRLWFRLICRRKIGRCGSNLEKHQSSAFLLFRAGKLLGKN